MNDEIRMLVQKRTTIKAQLTRFKGYLEKWSERPDKQQLVERLEKIKATWDKFDEVQSSIDALNTDEASDNSERALFEDAYFEVTARAQCGLAAPPAAAPFRPPAVVGNVGTIQTQSSGQNIKTNIKLPTINSPTFDGKYEAWLSFYDNFKSIVHDNENLTPVQKLQYLRSSLTNEAAQVIQLLETSSQNYEVAWALLVERYDNRRIIIQSHVRALFDLPKVIKESPLQLRSLVDAALKHTLHVLGQPTNSWDAVLLHLITSKLDRNTHKEWERSLDGTDMPSIDNFWKFLKNRCHVLESINPESSSQLTKLQTRENTRFNAGQNKQSLVTTHGIVHYVSRVITFFSAKGF